MSINFYVCSDFFLLKLADRKPKIVPLLESHSIFFFFCPIVTACVTEASRHYSDIHVVSIHPCSRRHLIPEFPRHANPTAQHTQLTNDYKNIITAFGFPTAVPLGQWSQLGGSLVMF